MPLTYENDCDYCKHYSIEPAAKGGGGLLMCKGIRRRNQNIERKCKEFEGK
jgi:hypothetical protein